ncbi:Uma2 family endonuclease [Thermoleptolyngbya sp. C42_A2020_037]|uniref:Uma2 family endonuclease n=1 Tax=Thermoleptolyngbya sp. C42_A2020_037 TaxID=2747799 RepID=UPI0019E4C26A|nr:Uma2 family endonuclease [Thermoleptolyngbya sp. C42_A2020_037]MBF2083371.1 Uma2 family endonuclease [Thermoleptolyngbya sp. C42_A2020_037]
MQSELPTPTAIAPGSLTVHLPPSLPLSEEQFFEFCQVNRDLRIEQNADGDLVIMSPVGSGTGNREAKIIQQLANWSDEDGTGLVFSSSAGFKLSTGAKRSPDAAWIRLDRWNALTPEQQERFAPICPDVVIELRSPNDSLETLQAKMREYQQEAGFQLGWLLDRGDRRAYIYRPSELVQVLDSPDSLSGDPVLPGFRLDLSKVW